MRHQLRLLVSLLLLGLTSCSAHVDAISASAKPVAGVTPSSDVAVAIRTSRDKSDMAPELSSAVQAEAQLAKKESSDATAHPLRRLLKSEVNWEIAENARKIIREHHRDPVGSEIAYVVDGQEYVARIEEHYHPPGGDKKPWGKHPGVSVFVALPTPTK